MNIRLSLHNVILIVAIAALGILALRMVSQTGVANVPVVGQIVRLGATA